MGIIAEPSEEDIKQFGGEAGKRMFYRKGLEMSDELGDLTKEQFELITRWNKVQDRETSLNVLHRICVYNEPVLDSDGEEAKLVVTYLAPDPEQDEDDNISALRDGNYEKAFGGAAQGLSSALQSNIVSIATTDIPEWALEELQQVLSGEAENEGSGNVLVAGQTDLLSTLNLSGSMRSLGNTFGKNTEFTRKRAAMVLRVADRVRNKG
jgi:hypothetical protein